MKFIKRLIGLLIPLALIAGLVWVWSDRQSLYDWWRLRGYNPPKAIALLASRDGLTASAKHIFYVNHPELLSSKTKFQQACLQTEKTIVLGCYHGDQQGIDIFDVTDSRLSGIEEVTAAHEMLHAAYDRLSKDDRVKVDGWLQDYYDNGLKDKRVLETIKSYRQSEPNDVVNEMHSIFGTEIAKLPKPLELYYKRYFTSRAKVVSYSEHYESAFTSREAQAKTLLKQINALKAQLTALSAELATEKSGLDADRNNINTQAEANAFNKRVVAYNAKVAQYQQLSSQLNNMIKQYNGIVIQQEQLLKAIDTRNKAPTQ